MTQKVIPKSIHEFLTTHLVKIEDEKEMILKEFFPKVTVESIEFEKLIANYIASIEDFIKQHQTEENEPEHLPFVLIGSTVDIEDIYDESVDTVRIISPFINQGQINYTFASYLSPLGKQLLLKKKRDRVKVNIPSGCSNYIINDIRLSWG